MDWNQYNSQAEETSYLRISARSERENEHILIIDLCQAKH